MRGTRVWLTGVALTTLTAFSEATGVREMPATTQPVEAVGMRAPGWHDEQTLRHDGQTRYFRFYVPERLEDHPAAVILLHGGTQSMRKIFRPNAGGTQAWRDLADANHFLLIVPNGTNARTGDPRGDYQNWNDCRSNAGAGATKADDVGFITALVDWAQEQVGIDPARVYVTGASNGGGMSYRLAIERPDRFAAVAVFIMSLPADSACGPPRTPVPILICNGTADPMVPWGGGGVAGGRRGTVTSAVDTLRAWQAANRSVLTGAEVTRYPDLDQTDHSTVSCERFLPQPGGAELLFCPVAGGGHAMPSRAHPVLRWVEWLLGRQNRDIEGAGLAWEFLRSHHLPGEASLP
jgi:polyhydroxybutyrate depolymerase